uniref:Secreted protein n=1 Tax=Caenorhabditis tropicalis TaxID=1561998 RepID=A0A1I7TDC9_9PELO
MIFAIGRSFRFLVLLRAIPASPRHSFPFPFSVLRSSSPRLLLFCFSSPSYSSFIAFWINNKFQQALMFTLHFRIVVFENICKRFNFRKV